MENLSTDNLMRLQVEQLEKEKKEINEKMRIVNKRMDHIERAYRKEERPLLVKDYEVQQANDKAAHEAAQKARIETARLTHQQDLETKKRLLRIMDDWKNYRDTVIGKRGKIVAPPASPHHSLLLILPSNAPNSTALSILRSTAAGHFRDWEAVWEAESGCAWEPLFDRYRLAEDGVLSVFLVNGTAVTVVDFDLSDV